MAPKISLALGFREREHTNKNPSILAFTGDLGQNYIDPGEGWGEQDERPVPQRRSSSGAKPTKSGSAWYTSLSSSLHGAHRTLTSRANKLHIRESARGAVSQLRKSTIRGSSSRTEHWHRTSTTAPRRSNLSRRDQPVTESESFDFMYTDVGPESDWGRHPTTYRAALAKLLPSRPWDHGSKQKRRRSKQLY